MLSNHGCFPAYLLRFKHNESSECQAGCRVPEYAEHVFFRCPRFAGEKKKLEERLGSSLTPETVVEMMLETEKKLDCGQQFRHRCHEENARRRAGTQKNDGTINSGSSLTLREDQKS